MGSVAPLFSVSPIIIMTELQTEFFSDLINFVLICLLSYKYIIFYCLAKEILAVTILYNDLMRLITTDSDADSEFHSLDI